MSATTTNITPTSQIGKTILGVSRELSATLGVPQTVDLSTTINAKRGVVASLTPTATTTLLYFGIGIGGRYTVSANNLTEPYPVQSTNMDLYTPIPFRCVPVAQDLSLSEQALYRIRVRQIINGSAYFCYYLKLISFSQGTVQINQTNPTTGLQTPYTLDYANLNPTQPVVSANGTTTTNTTEINVSVTSTLPITGAEVTEVINVFYAGDMRYAVLSEIGLYAGQDRIVTGLDVNALAFNYTEAIFAQLDTQYCWNGDDWSNPSRVSTYQIVNGSGSLLLL